MNRHNDTPDEQSPVEDRLRAAFAAKAGQVTEATLTRSADDLERPGARQTHRTGGWLRPISVAAALALLSAGIYAGAIRYATTDRPAAPDGSVVTQGPASTSPTSSSGPSGSPSPTSGPASGVLAGPVRELPRDQIPWSQVGAGWTVALWSATVDAGASGTLYLLSPAGTRYAVGTAPGGSHVSSVAPDGRRVLLTRFDQATAGETVTELDLTSGRQLHTFVVSSPSPPAAAAYTRPAGTSVLIGTYQGLERRSLDGTLELAYSTGNHLGEVLATPDGLDLFVGTGTGLALVGNGGTLVRAFDPPAGYMGCTPGRWWEPGVALTRCSQIGTPTTNLFLYPVSGAPVTQLTQAVAAATGATASPFGFTDAWRYSGGTLVQYGAGCGLGGVGMLTANGLATPRKLNLPATGEDGGPELAVVGDTAYVSVSPCGGGLAQSLSTYDLVTDRATAILGPGVNAGTVVDFTVLGQR